MEQNEKKVIIPQTKTELVKDIAEWFDSLDDDLKGIVLRFLAVELALRCFALLRDNFLSKENRGGDNE